MTFVDLYGDALNHELGSADVSSLFTTARRKSAINKAQLEFVKRTGCFRKSVAVPMVHNTREYDLEAIGIIAAQDFLRIAEDGVEYALTSGSTTTYRSGKDFPRRDVGWLNRQVPGWRSASATGQPHSWYLRQDGGKVYLGLSEPPSLTGSDTAAITVPYVARPADLSADGNEPFTGTGSDPLKVLEPWHQALAHYGAALLERLRKNVNAEQKQLTLFAGYVADYLQQQIPIDGETVTFARNYRASVRRGLWGGSRCDPLID